MHSSLGLGRMYFWNLGVKGVKWYAEGHEIRLEFPDWAASGRQRGLSGMLEDSLSLRASSFGIPFIPTSEQE